MLVMALHGLCLRRDGNRIARTGSFNRYRIALGSIIKRTADSADDADTGGRLTTSPGAPGNNEQRAMGPGGPRDSTENTDQY